MNVKRGFFRLWLLVISGGFLISFASFMDALINKRATEDSINIMFIMTIVIPFSLLIIGYAIMWAIEGFKKDSAE